MMVWVVWNLLVLVVLLSAKEGRVTSSALSNVCCDQQPHRVGMFVNPHLHPSMWTVSVTQLRSEDPCVHISLCLNQGEKMLANQNFFQQMLDYNVSMWIDDLHTSLPCGLQDAFHRKTDYSYIDRTRFSTHDNLFSLSIKSHQWDQVAHCLNTDRVPTCILDALGRATDESVDISMQPSSIDKEAYTYTNSTTEVTDAAFHVSNHCQLWWPLNNTDLFVHHYVPLHLSPLKIKQKFIIACQYPVEEEGQYSHVFVNITDLWQSSTCKSSPCSTTRFVKLSTKSVPQLFESVLELHHQSALNSSRSKHVLIDIVHPFYGKASFHIVLEVVYGVDQHRMIGHQPAYHPMASQLDSRDDLGFALAALLPNGSTFVEVGVQVGNYAELILNTWNQLVTYVAVDPWKAWPKDTYLDIANNEQHLQDLIFQQVVKRLEPYGNQAMIIRKESTTAAQLFEDESIDVVYLDAMHHYQAVKDDINAWWIKVKPCGLLAGHDYLLDVLHSTIFTVKPAVEAFARRNSLLIMQTYDEERPSYPTWFIYKPCQ